MSVIHSYRERNISTRKLLKWSCINHSSFYYKRSGGSKGIKPSTHCATQVGEIFENKAVVSDIEKTRNQEFCCNGYRNMTGELRDLGWIINHKWSSIDTTSGTMKKEGMAPLLEKPPNSFGTNILNPFP